MHRQNYLTILRTITLSIVLLLQFGLSVLQASEKQLVLEKNTATPLKLESDVAEIFVANPDIADIQQNNPKVAYIYGKKAGTTTIFATDVNGKVTTIDLTVTHNLSQFNKVLKSLYPGETVSAISSPAGIILAGSISTSQIAKNVESLAGQYIEASERVINNMSIATPTQVMLKVKIAEIDRTVLTRIGINWNLISTQDHIMFGVVPQNLPVVNGAFQLPTGLTPPPIAGFGFDFFDSHNNFAGVMDLLNQNGLATVLAEPNLVCLSGETAAFLVGGEIPIPVPQGFQTITIEFKEYGISLAFTPTVLSPKCINLRVRPEVSELDLDPTHALIFEITPGQPSIRIPAFLTRKAETSVELASGQSFAIAGLLSNLSTSQISEIPGLASLPIIGALFESTQFQKAQTELVIIVTPYIVKPSTPDCLTLPTDGFQHADTIEMLLDRQLNRTDCMLRDQFHLIGCCGFYVE
jgi:pilus assembly protein CpaC